MQALTVPIYKTSPVEVLESEIRKICGAFELEPMQGDGLAAGDVTLRHMDYLDAAVVALDARHVRRSAQSIQQDPGEHLFLLIQDEGHCRVEQGGHSIELAPGDMFLVDSVKPSTFVYGGRRSNQVSLHLPRDEMLHRFGFACTGGVAIDRQDPLWIAMRAVLTKMLTGTDVQGQLREAFLCLMGAYLQMGRSPARRAETILSRALVLIDCLREEPAFGPRELAARLNVSERVLQRHFRQLGETPGHRLLNRRLELAHARLSVRSPEHAREGVAGIAYSSGFNDLSYFYREFRKRYGTTPGSVARH